MNKSKTIVKAIDQEKKAIVKAIKVADPSIERINFGRVANKVHRFKKQILPFSFSYNNQSATGGYYNFDPSNEVTGSTFAIMQDWTNLKGLFNEYKVLNIKMIFTYQNIVTVPAGTAGTIASYISEDKSPWIMVRDYGEYEPTTPSLVLMAQYSNVIKKTFSVEHDQFIFYCHPQIAVPVFQGSGVLGTTSYKMQKTGWMDVNDPCLLYGVQFYLSSLSVSQNIVVDVEYDISFRSAQ